MIIDAAGWATCYDWGYCRKDTSILKPTGGAGFVTQTRAFLRQHTSNVLSVQNIMVRNTGSRVSVQRLRELTAQELRTLLPDAYQVLAITSSLAVLDCLGQQIKTLERPSASVRYIRHPTSSCSRSMASGRF